MKKSCMFVAIIKFSIMSYQDTTLWKRTLGLSGSAEPLRESFEDARKNAIFLLDKIRTDFPNLTVHDITHVDSLWEVADTIIGEEYSIKINPLEGYVLGISFLIHDAVLSYYTFGGIDKLRETIEWKDAYSDGAGEKDDEEFKKDCDFIAIRTLHAKKAEGILNETFKKDNGTTFYIIDNDTYRTHYGDVIGKIAASHHWDIDDVASKLPKQKNPISGFPREWKINAQKLACILRCADAGHIDNGRAPDCILHSLTINGISKSHWESQNHLCQVCEDDTNKAKLCITSSNPYKKVKEDIAAWNVAYEAVVQFDNELKSSNELLRIDGLEFPHDGVSGASSKEALAKYVETEGWKPCNFGVHTSNVKTLIETLGGSELYGEENPLFVVLRELIQNARDAIHARSRVDKSCSINDGRITVRYITNEQDRIIEIEDNGIGMSMNCIKRHLLDFGGSYWKSYLAKEENPGLRSSGFKSIGKYGIGFYSVFMVAKSVDIYTKRYDKRIDDANRIEFPEGLTLSPIMSNCNLDSSVSTIIRIKLKKDVNINFSIDYESNKFDNEKQKKNPIKTVLPRIVAGLDVDVYFDENGKQKRLHQSIIAPDFDKGEWLKGLYIGRLPSNIDLIVKELEVLKDADGTIKGILAISGHTSQNLSIETVSGLMASFKLRNKGFIGYVDSTESNISRNSIITAKSELLKNWTKMKYDENYESIIQSDILADNYCQMVSYCEINNNELIDRNMKMIYSTYQNRNIKIGSLYSVWKIAQLLYAGVRPLEYRFFINTYTSDQLDELDELPERSYENIMYKFYEVLSVFPTDENGISQCLSIWVNLMLYRFMGKMIDWGRCSNSELYKVFHWQLNGNYLKKLLSTTYKGDYGIRDGY